MASGVQFTSNIDEVITKLKIAGIAVQSAGAEAINRGAFYIAGQYNESLRNDMKHNRGGNFTSKACRVWQAHAMSGSKNTMRQMKDINAKVGILEMRDGRRHYLEARELGLGHKGSPKIANRVPIPLDSARGGSRSASVSPQYRMGKQFHFGGIIDLSRWAGNPRQQYAILSSMARSGKLWQKQKNSQISKHMQYMVEYGDRAFMFKVIGKNIKLLRDMSRDETSNRKRPLFNSATYKLKQSDLDAYFTLAANYMLNDLG